MPEVGSLYSVSNPRLQGLRKWAVKHYRKYLIFYIVWEDVIEVVRILYATQDISSILDREGSGAIFEKLILPICDRRSRFEERNPTSSLICWVLPPYGTLREGSTQPMVLIKSLKTRSP